MIARLVNYVLVSIGLHGPAPYLGCLSNEELDRKELPS